jgi:hypothetical protein
MNTKPMGVGRPTSYRPEFAEQAAKLCRLGAKDAELANFFEVDESTINRWKAAHPEFCKSLKSGKAQADAEVADRLFRRAIGYEHEAVKVFMPAGATAPVYATYTERFPPDPTSMIFWLKNRRPDLWRDAHRQEHTGKDGGPIETAALSPDERVAKVRRMLDEAYGSDGVEVPT